MNHQAEWIALHWKDFLLWCEAEFICRTLMAREGKGLAEWRSVMTRFTIADVIFRAQQLQAPLSVSEISARYYRHRRWAQWMAEHDKIPDHKLRRHRAYLTAYMLHGSKIGKSSAAP